MDRLAQVRAVAAAGPGTGTSDFELAGERPGGRALRPAGVLVPVRASGHLILTRRSARLRHHPGQIAFPGGKVDSGDTGPRAAALREAREEIGLEGADVWGEIDGHETVTGFMMHPFVALVPGAFRPVPEPGEVAEVFEVPLAHVLDVGAYRVERRRWQGAWRAYHTVPWGPHYIWGATARVLRRLAERL